MFRLFSVSNILNFKSIKLKGDSGGPLICLKDDSWVQFGIVSYYAYYCGASGWPGVFTDVHFYRDWIIKNAGGKEKFGKIAFNTVFLKSYKLL